jgi:hypothetical protein
MTLKVLTCDIKLKMILLRCFNILEIVGLEIVAALIMLGIMSLMGNSVNACTAYNCTKRCNVVDLHLPLGRNTFALSDVNGKIETTVYGKAVEMKTGKIIPVLRCLFD